MIVRKLMFGIILTGLWGVCATPALSQRDFNIEPDPVPNRSYRIRVRNEMGRAICVKIIPYGRSTYFHADLGCGESEVDRLWGGHRVVCVWDDRTGRVLAAGGVYVGRSGILRISRQHLCKPSLPRCIFVIEPE